MPSHQTSQEILDREFLPVRAKILQIAAVLDRIHRADGDVSDDPRCQQLRDAIGVLLQSQEKLALGDLAEQVQQIFSRSYDEKWQTAFSKK